MKLRTKLKRAKEENERLNAILRMPAVNYLAINRTETDVHKLKDTKVCRIDDPDYLDMCEKAMIEESIHDIAQKLKDDELVKIDITKDPYEGLLRVETTLMVLKER